MVLFYSPSHLNYISILYLNLFSIVSDKLVTQEFQIENEHNILEFTMTDQITEKRFFSSIQPKDLGKISSTSPMQPNIFVITLDEASSGHIQRKLSKSWKYLQNEMSSQAYPFYSAVNDQSVDNINSMLSGNYFNVHLSIFSESFIKIIGLQIKGYYYNCIFYCIAFLSVKKKQKKNG